MNEFLKQWENNMLVKGRADTTIKAYLDDVSIFLNWIKQEKKVKEVTIRNVKKITLKDLDDFMAYLRKPKADKNGKMREGNSFSTLNRRGNAIKTFFRYLQKNLKVINRNDNVTLDWELPKAEEKEMGFLNEDEIKALIRINGKRNKVRNTAIIMLLFNAGLRRQELIELNVNDIKDNMIIIKTGVAKGGKPGIVKINGKCLESLNRWLEVREKLKPMSPALFISEQGKRMSPNAVYNFIKASLKKIGREECSPHSIRHSCATRLLDKGNDLRTVQEVLRHKNINTTTRYTHVVDAKKQQAADSIELDIDLDE